MSLREELAEVRGVGGEVVRRCGGNLLPPLGADFVQEGAEDSSDTIKVALRQFLLGIGEFIAQGVGDALVGDPAVLLEDIDERPESRQAYLELLKIRKRVPASLQIRPERGKIIRLFKQAADVCNKRLDGYRQSLGGNSPRAVPLAPEQAAAWSR